MSEEDKRVPVRVVVPTEREAPSSSTKQHIEELDHRFKEYFGRLGNPTPRRPPDPNGRIPRYTDLFDSGTEYRVLVEVPGVKKEELDLAVSDRGLRIQVGTETDVYEEKSILVGRGDARSKMLRNVNFPEEVMAERAEASLNNDVLEVRVPKKVPTSESKHRIIAR